MCNPCVSPPAPVSWYTSEERAATTDASSTLAPPRLPNMGAPKSPLRQHADTPILTTERLASLSLTLPLPTPLRHQQSNEHMADTCTHNLKQGPHPTTHSFVLIDFPQVRSKIPPGEIKLHFDTNIEAKS